VLHYQDINNKVWWSFFRRLIERKFRSYRLWFYQTDTRFDQNSSVLILFTHCHASSYPFFMKNSFFKTKYWWKTKYEINFFLDILVLRPGYGLTPSPKAQTLPTCLDMQRSCDLDSTDLGTTNSYCKSFISNDH
jgi:hypothetical protein